MQTHTRYLVASVFCIIFAAACGDEPASGLSGLVYGKSDTSTPPPVSAESTKPLSERLRCGAECDSAVDIGARCEAGVRVVCNAGVVECEQCSSTGRDCRVQDGLAKCSRDCEDNPIPGTEFSQVCCPNSRWCEGSVQTFCSDTGLEVSRTPCAEGLDCVDGACVAAQPLVQVIFDTSESMNWLPYADTKPPTIFDYPACDDPQAPQSRLGIAKIAFATLFSDPAYDNVLFALQRFPQKLNPYVGIFCPSAQYQASNLMTGHAGIQASGGDWFKQYYPEVILEPFPTDLSSNRQVLQRWLDFDESKITTDRACSLDQECPGGFCVSSFCQQFDNPEVRAPAAATPLGYSLFYAGEFFREFVVLEGETCILDGDCASPHHYCVEGICRDRNRFCRQRSVVLFTDGVDTVAVGDFYQPYVQAKRLRAGLDCLTDADCGRDYICSGSTCQPASGNPCELIQMSCPTYDVALGDIGPGGSRLYDREGQPIDLTVHVIDASGVVTASAPVAGYGRGLLVQAPLSDAAALLKAIRPVFDWKDSDFCVQ